MIILLQPWKNRDLTSTLEQSSNSVEIHSRLNLVENQISQSERTKALEGLVSRLDELEVIGDSRSLWEVQDFIVSKVVLVEFIEVFRLPKGVNTFIINRLLFEHTLALAVVIV